MERAHLIDDHDRRMKNLQVIDSDDEYVSKPRHVKSKKHSNSPGRSFGIATGDTENPTGRKLASSHLSGFGNTTASNVGLSIAQMINRHS